MKIVNTGYKTAHPEGFLVSRPGGSGDYMILLIKTSAFFVLNDEKIVTEPNTLIVFRKGTPQFYGSIEGHGYTDDWVHFEAADKEIAELEKLGIPMDTLIKPDNISPISDLIKAMFTEKYSSNIYKDEIAANYLKIIFYKISDCIKNNDCGPKSGKYYKALLELRTKIYNTPEQNRSIDSIAAGLYISRSYLQHLYKMYFGTNILGDIKKSRLEHARYILSSTNTSVEKTAYMCGYKNDVHFMRQFKEMYGLTPSEFRKANNVSEDERKKALNFNPYII